MVFSDLDGTLIDHDSYDWSPACAALDRLRDISAGLVLASSKTAAEISLLRHELAYTHWPAIVENGSGMLPPHQDSVPNDGEYTRLRAVLNDMPQELRQHFVGFGDMDLNDIVQATGLTPDAASLAKQRHFSEPGEWRGNAHQKDAFLAHLGQHGIVAQQGGRFLTLSFGRNKVDQMRALIEIHEPAHTIALGDAPNDIAMIEAAEFGVVIANPHRPPLPPLQGEAEGRILRTEQAGPWGWNEAILSLIEQLNMN